MKINVAPLILASTLISFSNLGYGETVIDLVENLATATEATATEATATEATATEATATEATATEATATEVNDDFESAISDRTDYFGFEKGTSEKYDSKQNDGVIYQLLDIIDK